MADFIEITDGIKRKYFQDSDQSLIPYSVAYGGTTTVTGTLGTPVYDGGASWVSSYGVSGARFTSANVSGTATSITDVPIAGQKLVVTDILISVDTTMRVDIQEETTATVIASLYLPSNSVVQWTPRSKTKLSTANKRLQVKSNATGNIAITAHYFSEP